MFQIILRVAKTKKEEGLGSFLICQLITLKYNVGHIIRVLKTCKTKLVSEGCDYGIQTLWLYVCVIE